jgi:hypothetical protein
MAGSISRSAPFEPRETPLPRAMEIDAIVRLGRERAELAPSHPASVVLHVATRLLEELAAERGLLSEDCGALSEPAEETGPRSRMERFIGTIEAVSDRFLAEGAHPPNLAGALRAEADRVERQQPRED